MADTDLQLRKRSYTDLDDANPRNFGSKSGFVNSSGLGRDSSRVGFAEARQSDLGLQRATDLVSTGAGLGKCVSRTSKVIRNEWDKFATA